MNLFIVWTRYQSRSENLTLDLSQKLKKTKIVYRDNKPSSPLKKIFLYIKYVIQDFSLLLKENPEFVVLQAPPTYIALAPLIYKFFINKKLIIIMDMHNAMFRSKWLNTFGTKKIIQNINLGIVHNDVVFENINAQNLYNNVIEDKFITLEDKTVKLEVSYKKSIKEVDQRKMVFFPASFNDDEPINEVINVALDNPKVDFVLTGNVQKLKKNHNIQLEDIPVNMIITGWITNEEYNQYLVNCDILLGLTIHDDIQMSVSNEGLGANKAMLLSNTKTLKMIYKDCAIYVNNNTESISEGLIKAINLKEQLEQNSQKVFLNKQERYLGQINNLINKINKIRGII